MSNNRYSYNYTQRRPEDFEIQMFHMVQFDRMNGREAYEAKEKKAQAEKLRQQQIEELKKLVQKVIPNVDFWRIREMMKTHVFSQHIEERLSTLFKAINELEKK